MTKRITASPRRMNHPVKKNSACIVILSGHRRFQTDASALNLSPDDFEKNRQSFERRVDDWLRIIVTAHFLRMPHYNRRPPRGRRHRGTLHERSHPLISVCEDMFRACWPREREPTSTVSPTTHWGDGFGAAAKSRFEPRPSPYCRESAGRWPSNWCIYSARI